MPNTLTWIAFVLPTPFQIATRLLLNTHLTQNDQPFWLLIISNPTALCSPNCFPSYVSLFLVFHFGLWGLFTYNEPSELMKVEQFPSSRYLLQRRCLFNLVQWIGARLPSIQGVFPWSMRPIRGPNPIAMTGFLLVPNGPKYSGPIWEQIHIKHLLRARNLLYALAHCYMFIF